MMLPVRRDGTPTPTLEQRVEAGVDLFDRGRVDYLVFSGGHPGTCPAGLWHFVLNMNLSSNVQRVCMCRWRAEE